jgi:hypothetical protein
MIVSRSPYSPALASYVEALWVHQGELPHRYERLLPSGRMQLLINLHSDELCEYSLGTCGCSAGRFRPSAPRRFNGVWQAREESRENR